MFKFIVSLSLLFATPVVAQPVSIDRITSIAKLSKDVCPKVLQLALKNVQEIDTVIESVLIAARNAGLTENEQTLFLNFCILYQDGVLHGIRMGRAN